MSELGAIITTPVYSMGDTIKARAEFKNFDGTAGTPTSPKFKVYDSNRKLLTTVDVTSAHRVAEGVYEVLYTIPAFSTDSAVLSYEFTGTLDGSPVRIPGEFIAKWA